MTHFEFASCVPFSEESSSADLPNGHSPRQGVLFRAASSEAPKMSLVNEIESLLQLDAHSSLRYADPNRSHLRSIKLDRRNALPQL